MFDKLKALFSEDKETVTQAEIETALAGTKFVDLKEGGYVAQEKFDKAVSAKTELSEKVVELEKATGGDDELKAKVESLTTQLEAANKAAATSEASVTRLTRERTVEAKLADKRFTRFAVSEIEALVDDETTFEEAAEKWLEDNPDYAPATDEGGDSAPAARVGTGKPGKGKPAEVDPAVAAFAKGLGIEEE